MDFDIQVTEDIASNPPTGGTNDPTASKFTLTHGSHPVTKVTVWIGKGAGCLSDRNLVKGIKITWDDGSHQSAKGGEIGDCLKETFPFNDEENVKDMIIRTGSRVDKLSFSTTATPSRKFEEGDNNGDEHTQYVGNGVLLGFTGTYNSQELVSIGSTFDEDY